MSSDVLRVVRVGTHTISSGSKTTLWDRLRTNRGTSAGGVNHRGSRLHVGTALLAGGDYPEAVQQSWGKGSSASKDVRLTEAELENQVSEYIGKMPFLWFKVEYTASTGSLRKYIERNSVALLSNAANKMSDPTLPNWLDHRCWHKDVRLSGLWNVDHVYEAYEPEFLEIFEQLIEEM